MVSVLLQTSYRRWCEDIHQSMSEELAVGVFPVRFQVSERKTLNVVCYLVIMHQITVQPGGEGAQDGSSY